LIHNVTRLEVLGSNFEEVRNVVARSDVQGFEAPGGVGTALIIAWLLIVLLPKMRGNSGIYVSFRAELVDAPGNRLPQQPNAVTGVYIMARSIFPLPFLPISGCMEMWGMVDSSQSWSRLASLKIVRVGVMASGSMKGHLHLGYGHQDRDRRLREGPLQSLADGEVRSELSDPGKSQGVDEILSRVGLGEEDGNVGGTGPIVVFLDEGASAGLRGVFILDGYWFNAGVVIT
jgi:hypothetical protein